MRAVLDPNVLVSAVLSRTGTPAVVLRSWIEGAYELIVSPALLEELERVLAYPKIAKKVSPHEARELLDVLRLHAVTLDDPDVAPPIQSRDPADDYLTSLAASAQAVLVSGDAGLLGLADRMPVYRPGGLLELPEVRLQ